MVSETLCSPGAPGSALSSPPSPPCRSSAASAAAPSARSGSTITDSDRPRVAPERASESPRKPSGPPGTLFHGRLGAFRFSSLLERDIVRKTGRAVCDFGLIEEGDRVMVCLSGGKDSHTLLDALRLLQRRSRVRFELVAVSIDPGFGGGEAAALAAHLEREGVTLRLARADYLPIIEARVRTGQAPCVVCSRFRRAFLYDLADELGCTKLALGHHADDAIETLLLNVLFTGRTAAMPARLRSDDGRHVVVRPLIYVSEAETRAYAAQRAYPILPCGCPYAGSPELKRQVVKKLLNDLEAGHPGIKDSLLAALGNIDPTHMLDRDLLAKLQRA